MSFERVVEKKQLFYYNFIKLLLRDYFKEDDDDVQ